MSFCHLPGSYVCGATTIGNFVPFHLYCNHSGGDKTSGSGPFVCQVFQNGNSLLQSCDKPVIFLQCQVDIIRVTIHRKLGAGEVSY